MKPVRFIRFALGLAVILLLSVIAVTVVLDPLFQYHLPLFGLKPVITNERYQNPGIARTFDYDCAIIGNSIVETMVVSEAREAFGCKTVKLASAGSHMLDWTYLMNIIEGREKQPKTVMIHIDPLLLTASTTELKHEMPEYLYDDDLLNDGSYWFNWSIHNEFTVPLIKRNLRNKIPDYENAVGYQPRERSAILAKVIRKEPADLSASTPETVKTAMENVELLTPYIERMSGTEFVFFFSPFSGLYWDQYARTNMLGSWQTVYETVAKRLLSFENCRFYLFMDDGMKTWMEELGHYADTYHFDRVISKGILRRIAAGEGLLTRENAGERIKEYFDYIRGLDFDGLYFNG